ncbi:hypothetical protein PPRY_b0794 [Pseudoalteromonas prydzensis ACAM 620]|nr:hypothetical protein [Pseudoalteromonas prydzensis ACAM 620]
MIEVAPHKSPQSASVDTEFCDDFAALKLKGKGLGSTGG